MKLWKKMLLIGLAGLLAAGVVVCAMASGSDPGFSDVDSNAWYAEAVAYCGEHGLMNGTSATTFDPEGTMTRSMLAAVLYRMEGSPAVTGEDAFTDTESGAWYSDAVLWCSRQGFVNGYGNGRFGTNDPVSREQLTTIFWRYAGSPEAQAGASFEDAAETSPWAAQAVSWADDTGMVAPVSGKVFAPKSNATRAQVAALMNLDSGRQAASGQSESGGKVLVAYFSRYGNTGYDSGVDATTSASIVVGMASCKAPPRRWPG